MRDERSFEDVYLLLKDAVGSLEGACRDRVFDPYQCYHWNSVPAIRQTLETLTTCLKVVEGRLGPEATERAEFLAQFEEVSSRA